MTIIYIANDGVQFSDKQECLIYEEEKERNSWKGVIKGLDANENPLSYDHPAFLEKVSIIACPTSEAVKAIQKRGNCEDLCIEGIDEPGVYIWDDMNNWVSVDALLKKHREEAEYLESLKESLMKKPQS